MCWPQARTLTKAAFNSLAWEVRDDAIVATCELRR